MYKHLRASSFLLLFFFSIVADAKVNIEVSENKALLSNEILYKIQKEHFFRNKNLDNINSKLFSSLLESLDSEKIYFTKQEVSKFKKKFSESSSNININVGYEFMNLYFNRLIEVTTYQLREVRKEDFNFDRSDEILLDDSLKEWQHSTFMLKKAWRSLAKNDVLTSTLAGQNLEEAINAIQKRYKNRLRRISQSNEEDTFSMIMNSLTGLFDPHSSYYSPKSAEDFEMTMSLKLEGIGALLTTKDDYPIIVSTVPGGPAEKSGKIHPDDRIVKITQIKSPSVDSIDVVGWRVDEVVQLIRGAAGTKLQLELIPAKTEDFSERKMVTLTREEVRLEEQAAKSKVIEIRNGARVLKIGIINLPAFYIDFNAWRDQEPDFRSSSRDVGVMLDEFNTQAVDGVLVDLRGNSGGSLYEANKLVGLFISSGATLQVKSNNGYIKPWGDRSAKQTWRKPMAVLVDRYSASASEIFAGAIQDYQRGLVLGHRTYGKGTVQKLDNLSSGQLKLTESKFYRVTGDGMQNKGIIPDIILPSSWDTEEIGESSLDASLPWDQIRPVLFNKFSMDLGWIQDLQKNHIERVATNPNLQYILDLRKRYDLKKDKKVLSLNLEQRKSEKIDRQQWVLKTENKRRENLGLIELNGFEELKDFNESKEEVDIDIDNDYLLNEGTQILSDYIFLDSNFEMSKAG